MVTINANPMRLAVQCQFSIECTRSIGFTSIVTVLLAIKTQTQPSLEWIFCPTWSKCWPLNEYQNAHTPENLSFLNCLKLEPASNANCSSNCSCICGDSSVKFKILMRYLDACIHQMPESMLPGSWLVGDRLIVGIITGCWATVDYLVVVWVPELMMAAAGGWVFLGPVWAFAWLCPLSLALGIPVALVLLFTRLASSWTNILEFSWVLTSPRLRQIWLQNYSP